MKLLSLRLSILTLFILFSQFGHASVIRHLRVVFQETPAQEAYLAWSTDKFMKKNYIYFDTQPRQGDLDQYAHVVETKDTLYFLTWDQRHATKLKSLKPNTTYYFVVRSGKYISREYHFKTAPDGSARYKLLLGGDSRSDRTQRRKVNRALKNVFQANPEIVALVHGGDFIANGWSWKSWKEWFDDHQLTITDEGRVLPIIPTRGNHEFMSPFFNSLWLSPGKKGRNYYKTTIGETALITLNTNRAHGGKQKKFLEKALKNAAKEQKWVLTNYHRPAWPAVKKAGRSKKHWVPLFEDYQVDLAFESDGHALKRTVPIYRNKHNPKKGIVYVGEGGMGVKMRIPKKAGEWYLQSPGYALSKYHFFLLGVGKDEMALEVLLPNGSLFDRVHFTPKNRNM